MRINKRSIIRLFSIITSIIGIVMILNVFTSFALSNMLEFKVFLCLSIIFIVLGTLGTKLIKPSKKPLKSRDGYFAIVSSLVYMSILGALPFILTNNANIVDSLFESVAGFTTTSATIIGVFNLTRSMALWKASMHWMGGIFVLIYSITYLPSIEMGSQQIATAESLSTNLNKIAPKKSQVIRQISILYFIFTSLSFIFILFSGIGPLESLIYAFGTSSTSAVKLHQEGLTYYGNTYLEIIISVFSIFAASNYVLYFYLSKKYLYEIKKNVEKRAFFTILIVATAVSFVFFLTSDTFDNKAVALKNSFVQVTSFATTSGYSTSDYLRWPIAVQTILVFLMIVGGCSGSTAGSMKVIRLLVIHKLIVRGIVKRLHPRAITPIKLGDTNISSSMANSVTTYALLFFFVTLFSTLILSLQNLDLETTFSAAIGTLTNTGISFGKIGSSGNYSMFNPLLKLYLCFLMIIGRLSIYTVFILFDRSFWIKQKRRVK